MCLLKNIHQLFFINQKHKYENIMDEVLSFLSKDTASAGWAALDTQSISYDCHSTCQSSEEAQLHIFCSNNIKRLFFLHLWIQTFYNPSYVTKLRKYGRWLLSRLGVVSLDLFLACVPFTGKCISTCVCLGERDTVNLCVQNQLESSSKSF